jgi:hypothetical protein
VTITIFVNERSAAVPSGVTVEEAITTMDTKLGADVASGRAYVTDGVGRRLAITSAVFAGAIYRVVAGAGREEPLEP